MVESKEAALVLLLDAFDVRAALVERPVPAWINLEEIASGKIKVFENYDKNIRADAKYEYNHIQQRYTLEWERKSVLEWG